MNTIKLLNIAIAINVVAVLLGVIFAFYKPDTHSSSSVITPVVLLVIMIFLRLSTSRRGNINGGKQTSANTLR